MEVLYLSYNNPMPLESMPLTNKDDRRAADLVYQLRSGTDRGPLLIMLHGLGGDEHAMSLLARSIPAAFTVISPRAPIAIEPGLFPGCTDRGYSWVRSAATLDRAVFAPAIDQLRRFIAAFDRTQVFLMGFSQGAALSYALSLAEPQLIAGVIALAGFLPDDAPLEQSAPFPRRGYLIIHGIDDQIVPIHHAHHARDVLLSLGAPVEYHAYPIGHKVAPQGLKDITRWLQTNVR